MVAPRVNVIQIDLREENNIVYASSKDMITLHVCGKTKDSVIQDVPKIIQRLYQLNHDIDVIVVAESDSNFDMLAVSEAHRFVASPTEDLRLVA